MLNINDINRLTADDVTGQYNAFGPSPSDVAEQTCTGSCTSTCIGQVDSSTCGDSCAGACKYTCTGGSDSSDVPGSCTECTGTCAGSCSGDCVGGCGDANCEGTCTLGCMSTCATGCETLCTGDCTGECAHDCVSGCKENCTGSCASGCQGCTGCSGGCISACVDGCKHSCMNVSTVAGTHVITPSWPVHDNGGTQVLGSEEEIIDALNCIKQYLNVIMQYDYTRISDLDEAVVLHDGDQFAANISLPVTQGESGESTVNGWTISEDGTALIRDDVTVRLEDVSLVTSDFDNHTVRISAASLVNFIRHNYRSEWAWYPYVHPKEGTDVNTIIDWIYREVQNPEDPDPADKPESIDIEDLITGEMLDVTTEHSGLMPSDLYIELLKDGLDVPYKEVMDQSFITGKTRDGSAVSSDTPVLRFESEYPALNVNDDFVNDLKSVFVTSGDYVTQTYADSHYSPISLVNTLNRLLNFVLGPDPEYPTDQYAHADYPATGSVPTIYLTEARASTLYAPISVQIRVNNIDNTVQNLQNTVSGIPNTYLSKTDAATDYVAKASATTDIPARVPSSINPASPGVNGLMTPTDVANIDDALDSITTINGQIIDIQAAISGLSPTGYATEETAGTVKIPRTSALSVASLGVIDIKDYSVNNLIKNSTFNEGFETAWTNNNAIDTSISTTSYDSTIERDISTIAFLADGEYSQSFVSDTKQGFTVGILFKKDSVAKTIELKIDSNNYTSHTIPAGSGYYRAEFYFTATDDDDFDTHTLTLHNPDVNNIVSYQFTEVMVQNGRQFTGWNRNPHDISDVNSINIISYDNYIKFKDREIRYTEDVYDLDGVTILHHAGDLVDPSSSIIMHKDKNYFYMHITALQQIDGQIRQDIIPLRIDLTTGECDISGNAVSAGTLIDNTGELVPTVAELNAFVNGSALDLVDQANEITVSTMPTAAEELVGNIYYYTGETTASFTQYHIYHCVFDDPDYVWEEYTGYQRKYKYSLNKTVNNVVTELASVLHVGRFAGINNAEIFNDYVGNTADTVFSHVEGQGNSALQSATHVHIEGAGNTAENGAAYTHIEGAGNTAENGAAYNHIEGTGHKATGSSSYSHIEGMANTNMQAYDHIEGYDNIGGYYSNHSCGSTMPNGNSLFRSVIVNTLPSISNTYNDEMYLVYDSTNRTYTAWDVDWSSDEGVWENNGSISLSSGGAYGHVEGRYNLMGSTTGHVEGSRNILKTSCDDTHIEGANNIVYEGSTQTHVEGKDHVVYNGVNYSHFEGLNNRSGYTGNGSGFTALHMEGQLNIASSGTNNSHMEGYNNAIQLAGGNAAHIEGYMNRPSQTNYSHIEGYKNSTTGTNYIVHVSGALNTVNGGHVGLHVEGKSNVVPYGKSSINASTDVITGNDIGGHIEGVNNSLVLNPNNSSMAVGGGYHIEGDSNKITYKDHLNNVMNTSNLLADDNHLEGGGNSICGGYRNHVEGDSNWLYGGATHVEGSSNKVYHADQGHVEGAYNNVNSASGTTYTLYYLHVEGQGNNVYGVTNGSHIEGQTNNIYSNNNAFQIHVEGTSHNLGSSTHNVSLQSIHVEGQGNSIESSVDSLSHSHIEGNANKVIKIDDIGNQYVNYIHIEGYNNQVNANYSHTEGASNKVYGDGYYNHMEGYNNISHGQYDHTEGLDNHNYGTIGHIEGQNNTIGAYDAVGKRVTNYANHCHVEGSHNLSLGSVNHVEGEYNTAYGNYNHIEGYHNESYAHETHTAGSYNINATMNSTVIGQYNEPDTTYGATSIIPNDITITNTSYISRVAGSLGQVVYDGSTTLGVTDYIELPHMPIGFHFTGTNATGGAIAIYDSNKVCLDVLQMTETGTVDIDVTPYSQTEMITRPNWRDAKYIRLCAVMSTSGLNGAQLFLMKEPHLFIVGNGTFDSTPSVTARSNILEVGLDKININGDIYQNGELFKSGTPHFVGTSIEWEALTSEEKAAYEGGDIVFTDDNAGSGIIDQVVTPDSPNPVSGGAVYTALTNMSNPMVSRSTNGYYTGRKYYDGRTTVHYRRKFTSTSLTANDVTRVVLGDWDGIDSSFNTLITNAFSNNNNVTYMTIIKDAMDVHICQINCISTSLNDHVAYIACIGTGNYTGEFTIDICIDSY